MITEEKPPFVVEGIEDSTQSFHVNLNITEERADEISNIVVEHISVKGGTKSNAIREIVNQLKTFNEVVFACVQFGRFDALHQVKNDPLFALSVLMSEDPCQCPDCTAKREREENENQQTNNTGV